MKKNLFLLLFIFVVIALQAQRMQVKKFNLTSFNTDKKNNSELLNGKSSSAAKQHPEFGVLPYNSQCKECLELIDKRTIDSRFYIDPKNEGHTYSQQSFFPLHYKKQPNDIWRTIDTRLHSNTNGVYTAPNQPVPTKCDLNAKSTSLTEKGFEFEFNKNLSLYFFDYNTVYTQKQTGNYADYTIGEEGLRVRNIWTGIDMEQIFKVGEVKSNFVISAPLQLPITKGWMVIEDHFTLPENISIVEDEHGSHLPEGYYRGDYLLKNEKGETLITYSKPVYIDAKVFGMHGIYNLLRTGNNYTLQTLVPVEWLAKADNTYPLMIDPSVYGATKIGDFSLTGFPAANMAFTSMALGSCDYHMSVGIPGKSTLSRTFVDVEYSLTYDNTCGAPPLPPPFCTFSQVSMEVECDTCHTTTGPLSCNPALPPYTGTCTTDSNLVPGANGILVNNFVPNYIACLPPQCQYHNIGFTLRNRDSICGDVCGYLCARGNMWRITVEAKQVDGFITQDTNQVCYGDAVVFTAHPNYGVPPYQFAWTKDGGNTFDTIYGNPNYTIYPQQDISVFCKIIDTCGIGWETSTLNVTVLSAVVISVSGDTLTSPNCCFNQWYLNGTVIDSATSQTYIVTTAGVYTVQTSDTLVCPSGISAPVNFNCVAYFTIHPSPLLQDTGVYYGTNQSTGTNLNYLWNFGDGTTSTSAYPSHTYTQPGQYYVCLTISNFLCSDTYCDSSFYVFKTEGGLMTQLNIQSPTGINNLKKDEAIKLFPNPATNELNIATGGAPIEQVKIFSADGKLMTDIKQSFSHIDISQFAKGVYVAEVRIKNAVKKIRWVKM